MTFEELKSKKKISGVFQGSIVDLKVNLLTAEDSKNNNIDCIQLSGKWDGFKIKSDYLFNDSDVESIEQNIAFI